jgi:Helix-turn-helix domain
MLTASSSATVIPYPSMASLPATPPMAARWRRQTDTSIAPAIPPHDDTITAGTPIVGHRGRDEWLDTVALLSADEASVYKVAICLYRHFNCKTGQCNPGFKTIAAETGLSIRTVRRAIKVLEAEGLLQPWMQPGAKRDFVLTLPAEPIAADVTPSKPVTPDVTGDGDETCDTSCHRSDLKPVTRNGPTCDTEGGVPVTPGVTIKEHWNTGKLKSAPTARSSADVEREVAVDLSDYQERAYGALERMIPNQPHDPACRDTFLQIISGEIDDVESLLGDATYAVENWANGHGLKQPLSRWLRAYLP